MRPAPAAPDLLADLTRRGFTFRVLLGGLPVSRASVLTSEDREAIRERRDELLATLSPAERWDSSVAVKLMCDADALVERSGESISRTLAKSSDQADYLAKQMSRGAALLGSAVGIARNRLSPVRSWLSGGCVLPVRTDGERADGFPNRCRASRSRPARSGEPGTHAQSSSPTFESVDNRPRQSETRSGAKFGKKSVDLLKDSVNGVI
jgi:hypothetical protein